MWGRVVKIALSLPFLIVSGLFGLYLVFGFSLVNPQAHKLLPCARAGGRAWMLQAMY
jgi:hypothetical protein